MNGRIIRTIAGRPQRASVADRIGGTQPMVARKRRPWRRLLATATLLLTAALPCRATQVRPLNLEEMTRKAERILSGRCIAVDTESDHRLGIPITVVTLRVDQVSKGSAGPIVTFRMPAGGSSSGAGFVGIPAFHPGEELVLFLYGDSRLGLTSPVGLGQGKFVVARDKRGRRIAVNEHGNRTLFRRLSPEVAARWKTHAGDRSVETGIDPDMLLRLVRELDR